MTGAAVVTNVLTASSIEASDIKAQASHRKSPEVSPFHLLENQPNGEASTGRL